MSGTELILLGTVETQNDMSSISQFILSITAVCWIWPLSHVASVGTATAVARVPPSDSFILGGITRQKE